jgi:hypothetical protein
MEDGGHRRVYAKTNISLVIIRFSLPTPLLSVMGQRQNNSRRQKHSASDENISALPKSPKNPGQASVYHIIYSDGSVYK